MDAVLIEKAAKARAVNNPGLEQEPRAFPSSRTACLKSQSNQVLGIDNANETRNTSANDATRQFYADFSTHF